MTRNYHDPMVGIVLSIAIFSIWCCYCFLLLCHKIKYNRKIDNNIVVKASGTRQLTREPYITITINNPISFTTDQIQV
jgi:hypothetical protein